MIKLGSRQGAPSEAATSAAEQQLAELIAAARHGRTARVEQIARLESTDLANGLRALPSPSPTYLSSLLGTRLVAAALVGTAVAGVLAFPVAGRLRRLLWPEPPSAIAPAAPPAAPAQPAPSSSAAARSLGGSALPVAHIPEVRSESQELAAAQRPSRAPLRSPLGTSARHPAAPTANPVALAVGRSEARSPTPPAEPVQIAQVMAELNARGNPRGTLQQLAAYWRTFPHGAFAREARIAEVRAHLALGETEAALASLERAGGPAGGEELVVAAELCDQLRRGARAAALREEALAQQLPPLLRARALIDRGNDRWRSGSVAAARADYRAALVLAPGAAEASALRARLTEGE